jgi:Ca2+/Na+ antiporter
MSCEEGYGFLPCSSSVGGSLMLMLGYGYVLLKGAEYISDGSERLLEVLDPGLIGGLLLPVLGAVPDAAIIVVSGLGGSVEEAQDQVSVGMGTLAGSTIMLLTLAWGGSVLLGRCTLQGGAAVDKLLLDGTVNWSAFGRAGVTTDGPTRNAAKMMLVSSLLYLVVQVPALLKHSDDAHDSVARACALAALVLCALSLCAYCAYMVMMPELQKKKAAKARLRLVKLQLNRAMLKSLGEDLVDPATHEVQRDRVDALFDRIDLDKSGSLDQGELNAFITGFVAALDGTAVFEMEARAALAEQGLTSSTTITRDNFFGFMDHWIRAARNSRVRGMTMLGTGQTRASVVTLDQALLMSAEDGHSPEDADLEDIEEEEEEKASEEPQTPGEIWRSALMFLVGGLVIITVFSDPMCDTISNFSAATGVPAFFVSFVVTPLASNASELVSSLRFAMKKRRKNISLTFSQVYGAVVMNNTLCLGVFCALVWARGLRWDFTAEVLVTLLAIVAMGLLGSSGETFTCRAALFSLSLYPLSIALVVVLKLVLKLS